MKSLSEEIEAARPSGYWIANAVAVLVICLGFITFSGGSRESLKIAVVGYGASLLCLVGSVLYTRRDIRGAAARARALEEQAAAAKSGK